MTIRTTTLSALAFAFAAASELAFSQEHTPVSSISIKWTDRHDDKTLTIESGADELFTKKLDGDSLRIPVDSMIDGRAGAGAVPATVSLEDFDELAIGVNLFRCATTCDWRITFTEFDERTSQTTMRTCQSDPKPLDGQYRKYFFCRDSYRKYVAANDKCWDISLTALTGWFESAYRMHTLTLKEGVGFFARDTEVEKLVLKSLADCTTFEQTVGRNRGYFKGMIDNLDIAVLQLTQRVERALRADQHDDARIIAEEVVNQLEGSGSLRDSIPAKDASYIESIINRARPHTTSFRLH
ncbi:MAG: hypothetical protein M3Y78_07805 [Pseudomonadota bacterium]|nr:hypothetical protein [Pseudomonadota bacterium]